MSRPITSAPDARALRYGSQPRRGLSRLEAAVYLGIGTTKFDDGVAAGLIPKPKTGGFLGARKVWDLRALDRAFDELPGDDGGNPGDGDSAGLREPDWFAVARARGEALDAGRIPDTGQPFPRRSNSVDEQSGQRSPSSRAVVVRLPSPLPRRKPRMPDRLGEAIEAASRASTDNGLLQGAGQIADFAVFRFEVGTDRARAEQVARHWLEEAARSLGVETRDRT
jgi:hypothetical protein